MERPSGLNAKLAGSIIILFHVVGLVGLLLPALRPLFLQIVPFHLLLMMLVVFFSHNLINGRYLGFILTIYILGFAAEWIGVHKGWLFGNYAYGKTLGTKLFDIPLTIGVNWFLLIYAVGISMKLSRIRSQWARIILGALMLVWLDLLIEPVAIKFDYWHWANNVIPFENYVGWFVVSVIMLWIFEQFKFRKQNWVAPLLLAVQFAFFGILNVL